MIDAINTGNAGPRGAPDRAPAASDWQAREHFADIVSRLQDDASGRAPLLPVEGWAVFAESVTAPAAETGAPSYDRAEDLAEGTPRRATERADAAQTSALMADMRTASPPAGQTAPGVRIAQAADAAPRDAKPRTNLQTSLSPLTAVDARRASERAGADKPAALSSTRADTRMPNRPAASAIAHRADSGRVDVAVRLFEPTAEETQRLQQRLHDELGRMNLPAYRLWINGTEVVTSVQSEEEHGH